MIQDIYPHNFSITYKNIEPKDDSLVFFFCKGELLAKGTQQKKKSVYSISFPTFSQVKQFCKEPVYLFSLDDKDIFRVVVEEKEFENEINQVLNSAEEPYLFRNRSFFRNTITKELTLASITGMHLEGWYSKSRFCGACGGKTVHDSKERMMKCPECGNMIFPRINPAVIVAVVHEGKVLLTKYRDREYKRYALIAGFAEIGESFEETVRREVMEEAGIKVKNITYYKSQPWGFSDNILAGYYCEVDGAAKINMDEEELALAEWVDFDHLPEEHSELSLTNEMIKNAANFKF